MPHPTYRIGRSPARHPAKGPVYHPGPLGLQVKTINIPGMEQKDEKTSRWRGRQVAFLVLAAVSSSWAFGRGMRRVGDVLTTAYTK